MQKMTGLEYLYIDIANQAGHDKKSWDYRLYWAKRYEKGFEKMIQKNPTNYLFAKAVRALRDTQAGKETGFIMGLDACASGVQCMSALSGDKMGGSNCGLINTGKREDFYTNLVKEMNKILPDDKQIAL